MGYWVKEHKRKKDVIGTTCSKKGTYISFKKARTTKTEERKS